VRSLAILLLIIGCWEAHGIELYEPWAVETRPNGMVNIEINVKGCITKFLIPEKDMHRDDAMDQMLEISEKRQAGGCK
jgi:hypothetical protein